MGSLARTMVAALTFLLMTGCSGDADSTTDEPSTTPSSVPVVPEQPRVEGRVAVELRPGLTVMTDDECRPAGLRRVCSTDGTGSWAPISRGTGATVVLAETHVADLHTTWTTVLRFAGGSRPALRRTAVQAAAAGGLVLVMRGTEVLAAVPPSGVRGRTAVMNDLDKSTAWGLVAAFEQ